MKRYLLATVVGLTALGFAAPVHARGGRGPAIRPVPVHRPLRVRPPIGVLRPLPVRPVRHPVLRPLVRPVRLPVLRPPIRPRPVRPPVIVVVRRSHLLRHHHGVGVVGGGYASGGGAVGGSYGAGGGGLPCPTEDADAEAGIVDDGVTPATDDPTQDATGIDSFYGCCVPFNPYGYFIPSTEEGTAPAVEPGEPPPVP